MLHLAQLGTDNTHFTGNSKQLKQGEQMGKDKTQKVEEGP